MHIPTNNLAAIELCSPLSTSYGLLTFPYVRFLGIRKIILGASSWLGDFGIHLSRSVAYPGFFFGWGGMFNKFS